MFKKLISGISLSFMLQNGWQI